MAKKLSSVLGIDIGSRKIKVAEIKAQGSTALVTAMGIADTPEGAVDHSGVYNGEAVGAVLKDLLKSAKVSVGNAVVSIAGQNSVLVRTLEVPRMNPQELTEYMQWEINRNIPFAESTVVSDFKPLGGEDPNSPNIEVVMAIAPQSAIDVMIQVVKKAGKNPVAIDVEPLGIARSIQMSYSDELANQTVCVVDMGASTTSINIYQGSRLVMPRQIPMGGDLFTKAIADAMTLPLADAEGVKVGYTIPEDAADRQATVVNPFDIPGVQTQEFAPYNPFADSAPVSNPFADPAPVNPFADPDVTSASEPDTTTGDTVDYGSQPLTPINDAVYTAIAPLLEDFVSEIRRSVDYFRSRGGDVNLIVLSGGGCKLGGLATFVGKSVGVACDAYDPVRRLNVNSQRVPEGFLNEHRQEFAVAVGNGLHIFFD